MLDGRRLSGCSDKLSNKAIPATDISAPESGRTLMSVVPLREDMCICTVSNTAEQTRSIHLRR